MANGNVRGRSDIFVDRPDLSFNENTNFVKKMLQSNGIYNKYQEDWFNKFARIGVVDPYNALTNTKEYIFMTKPDLCLMDSNGQPLPSIANSPFFVDAILRYPDVARQLQTYGFTNISPFMSMISNTVTSSLDIPEISANMINTGSNIMGTNIKYRGTSYKSDEDHDFSLEFEDTKYLDVYMLFKMWDEYEKLKWDGLIDFSNERLSHWQDYILNKVLHDQVSIYKFVVGEDGMRIVYFARITGAIPLGAPRNAFSDMTGTDTQKITVNFSSHFVRDMDPIIIKQFNSIIRKYHPNLILGRNPIPLYDMDIHAFNGEWASTPYIKEKQVTNRGSTYIDYYLEWY